MCWLSGLLFAIPVAVQASGARLGDVDASTTVAEVVQSGMAANATGTNEVVLGATAESHGVNTLNLPSVGLSGVYLGGKALQAELDERYATVTNVIATYATQDSLKSAGKVQSVNGATGAVSVTAASIGAATTGALADVEKSARSKLDMAVYGTKRTLEGVKVLLFGYYDYNGAFPASTPDSAAQYSAYAVQAPSDPLLFTADVAPAGGDVLHFSLSFSESAASPWGVVCPVANCSYTYYGSAYDTTADLGAYSDDGAPGGIPDADGRLDPCTDTDGYQSRVETPFGQYYLRLRLDGPSYAGDPTGDVLATASSVAERLDGEVVRLGKGATAYEEASPPTGVAIGVDASLHAYGTAIGASASARYNGTAIGAGASAAYDGTAIGYNAYVSGYSDHEIVSGQVAFSASPTNFLLNSTRDDWGASAYSLQSLLDERAKRYTFVTTNTTLITAADGVLYALAATTNGFDVTLPEAADYAQDFAIRVACADEAGTQIGVVSNLTERVDFPNGDPRTAGALKGTNYVTFTQTAKDAWCIGFFAATKEE